MCGIVGVINPMILSHEKWFEQALIVDQLRGFHSTGAYAATADKVMWDKAAVIGTHFIARPQFKSMLATSGLRALVGHNRWATQGDVVKANAHPFHHGDITLVHNGTLRTDAPGVTKDQFGTDSEGIAFALSKDGATAEEVLGELNGAFALVWHDLHDNCIRMIRNDDRPLWLSKCKLHDTILFASEPKMIEWLADRNKIELAGAPYQIQDGMLYRFDLNQTKTEDRIKPYIKQVKLRPKYSYSYQNWGRPKWWEEEESFPSRASQTQSRKPANHQPPAVIDMPPRVRETTMLPAERDEFLKEHGLEINQNIVCSVLDVTLEKTNKFRVDAVADLDPANQGARGDGDPDVVVYNVPAPMSLSKHLESATYVCGKIVNVRKIDGAPVIVLNPGTVWIADDKWDMIYEGDTTEQDKKIDTGRADLPGPQGKKVSRDEWDSLTAGGCASCGTRFHGKEAELIEWVGERPVCHHCACDDEAVARVVVKH